MDQELLDFYKDQLKYAGFGDKLNDRLGELFKDDGNRIVTLNTDMQFGKDKNARTVNYELRFHKSENRSIFFLNNFSASLEKANGEKVSNTFYLDKAKGITAKEAFNLLEGRSVYKELKNKVGETYNAWVKLNPDNRDEKGNMKFALYNDNYGYDLSAAVEKAQSNNITTGLLKDEVLKSLKKGNLVEMQVKGSNEKILIAADPQFKTISIFNEAGEKQFVDNKQAETRSQKPAVKEEIKEKKSNPRKR